MIYSLMKPSKEHLFDNINYFLLCSIVIGFPGGSVIQNLPANAGDTVAIPGSGRCPREGNGTQSSILAGEIPAESHRQRSLASCNQ